MLTEFTYPKDPKICLFVGADEAGRGPLCGNVVAGAVVLDPNNPITKKQLQLRLMN